MGKSGHAQRGPWRSEPMLLVGTVGLLVAGGLAMAAGQRTVADACWLASAVIALVPALWWVVVALRHRRVGVDLIAVLALVGTAVVHEYLAGALIAVMLASGRALEGAAERRASRDLRALLERAPRVARRRLGDEVAVVPVDDVVVGDLLVVAPGEVVPVDGDVAGSVCAVLDESVLTGEPEFVERPVGDRVRSGVVNAGSGFELRAAATAADSTYAGIVRLTQQAKAENAPVVRLADRYAAWFLPLSLLMSGLAWLISGSAVRAVAVLVVATPCPLILAAPVAIVSGLSRASRRGVVVRGGAALEGLGHAKTLLLDKTGTLTAGAPSVIEMAAAPGWEPAEVLRLAASADQFSPHVFAQAIVREARARAQSLSIPRDVSDQPGLGVVATVEGMRVGIGKRRLEPDAPDWARVAVGRAVLDAAAVAWLTVDDALAGAILLRDPLRQDAHRTMRRLRAAGIDRLVMLTGDRTEPAHEIAVALGLDGVYAEQSPMDKVAAVREERSRAVTVMVGDGINDAPALAAATVGVAMGARGATASSEAADVVLTVDRVDRLGEAIEIARRARLIAVQSAVVGMSMSLAAMVIAAFGWLPPAWGALLQEGIDIAVIVNALRALRADRASQVALEHKTDLLLQHFAGEHEQLRDSLALLRDAADLLVAAPSATALDAVRRAHSILVERVLPHERAEEHELYPALAAPLGSEATLPMSRTHAEIERLAHRLGTHLQLADMSGELARDQIEDLLSTLYGLHEVLQLHFVQEEESYFTLTTTPDDHSTLPAIEKEDRQTR